jgi:hypothetical protein
MLVLGLLGAAVSLLCFGWVGVRLARDWLANRRDLDRVERAAHQRLINALTDPPPRRWK